MKILTIGSDPELFLLDAGENEVVSAIGMIGGTKESPRLLEAGFSVQEDNVLVEYNTPPVESKAAFQVAIARGLELTQNLLPKNYKLLIKASHILDRRHLVGKAEIFGCSPDTNAWTLEEQIVDAPATGLRVAGGHVYIGYEGVAEGLNIKIAKALDIFLGLPSVILEEDTVRRMLYGKAGSFRHKDFGLEYRSLSNFWIADDELVGWIYDNSQLALQFVADGGVDQLEELDGVLIQAAINSSNKELAKELIEKFNVPYEGK